ncbi:hypothetical protein ACFL1R_08035 [Candidatus Latescibacterota bacterium]
MAIFFYKKRLVTMTVFIALVVMGAITGNAQGLDSELFNEIENYKTEYEKYQRGNKSAGIRAIGHLKDIRSISQKLRILIQKDVRGGKSLLQTGIQDLHAQLINAVENFKTEYEKYQRGNKSAGIRAIGHLKDIRSISQELIVSILSSKK